MMLLKLFWSFFQIGLFSIGGGYAAMPLIEQQVVSLHGWLTVVEFADIVTISQMTPGPIAINAATFVGTRIGGVVGAVVATMGCVLPSSAIVLILAYLYGRYRQLSLVQGIMGAMRPAVVALIASAGLTIFTLMLWNGGAPSLRIQDVDGLAAVLFAVALVLLRRFKLSPTLVMLGAGAVGLVGYALIG